MVAKGQSGHKDYFALFQKRGANGNQGLLPSPVAETKPNFFWEESD
jgi:hypothetical protein